MVEEALGRMGKEERRRRRDWVSAVQTSEQEPEEAGWEDLGL